MKSGWLRIRLTCKTKKWGILNDSTTFIFLFSWCLQCIPSCIILMRNQRHDSNRGPCIISYCFQWMLHDIAFWVETIPKKKALLSKLKFSYGKGVAMTSREWHHCVTFLMIWGVSGTEQKTNDLITKMMFLFFPFSGLLL